MNIWSWAAGKRPRVYFVGRSSSLKRVIWNVKLKPGSWTLQKLNQWLVRLAELTSPHCVRAMRLIQWKIRFNFRYGKGWGEQRRKDNKNKTKTIRRIRSKLPFILKNNSDKVFRAQYCSFNPSLDHRPSLIMNVFCWHTKWSAKNGQMHVMWQNRLTGRQLPNPLNLFIKRTKERRAFLQVLMFTRLLYS